MPEFDLIQIRMKLAGGREVVAEASAAAGAIKGVGTASAASGAAAGKSAAQSKRFGAGLASLGFIAKGGAAAGLFALGVETVRSVNAFREARKVGLQTKAVIKSTGGVANVTAQQVSSLAEALSIKTGVDDEEVQASTNMLLTFTNIRNEAGKHNKVLDQATESVLDLAAATKTDGISAAKQLGKALQDPAVGLTALRRSGVSFNEEQTEMIKGLFESGKRLRAQKTILREVEKEFKGSARANNDAVDRLGVAWENLEEEGGRVLFPLLAKGVRGIAEFVTGMRTGAGAGGGFANTIRNIAGAVGAAVGWVKRAVGSFRQWLEGSSQLRQNLGAIATFLRGVLAFAFRFVLQTAKRAWAGIKQGFQGLVQFFKGAVQLIGGILRGDFGQIWQGVKNIVGGAVRTIIGLIRILTAPFREVFGALGNIITKGIGTALLFVMGVIEDVIGFIGDAIDMVGELKSVVDDVTGFLDPLGGGGPNFTDLLPGNAAGTLSWSGGLTVVGERGPELVHLPSRTDIFSAPDSRRIIRGLAAGRSPSSARVAPVPMPSLGGTIQVRAPVYLDKRKIAEAVTEVVDTDQARR